MMRRDQSMTIIVMAVLAYAKAVSRSPLFFATGKISVGAFVCGVAECNRRGQTTMRRTRTMPRRGRGERHDSASDLNDARSHGPTRRADAIVSSRERCKHRFHRHHRTIQSYERPQRRTSSRRCRRWKMTRSTLLRRHATRRFYQSAGEIPRE